MGFYRLHLLEIVTIEFLIVPLLLVVGGTFGFFTAVFGFYATSKEDSCLLVTHAVFMSINFGLLLAGMVSSVRLIFFIKTGLFNSDVIPDMNMYETNAWVRYRWDTLQCKKLQIKVAASRTHEKVNHLIKNDTISDEFACCGGYSYNIGYQDWKHSHMGMQYNSVPDSCCLRSAPKCGWGIFRNYDDRNVYPQIFTHGCITLLQRRLETQVIVSKNCYVF